MTDAEDAIRYQAMRDQLQGQIDGIIEAVGPALPLVSDDGTSNLGGLIQELTELRDTIPAAPTEAELRADRLAAGPDSLG